MSTKHGLHGTPTYNSWRNMRQRCLNPRHPKYPDYGSRGITVCERWSSFENFFADMGTRPNGMTLERKRNNGNYEPGNCIWATATVQARNQRSTKLTMEIADLMRDMWAHGVPQMHIAALLSVHRSLVTNVLGGYNWKA